MKGALCLREMAVGCTTRFGLQLRCCFPPSSHAVQNHLKPSHAAKLWHVYTAQILKDWTPREALTHLVVYAGYAQYATLVGSGKLFEMDPSDGAVPPASLRRCLSAYPQESPVKWSLTLAEAVD